MWWLISITMFNFGIAGYNLFGFFFLWKSFTFGVGMTPVNIGLGIWLSVMWKTRWKYDVD